MSGYSSDWATNSSTYSRRVSNRLGGDGGDSVLAGAHHHGEHAYTMAGRPESAVALCL